MVNRVNRISEEVKREIGTILQQGLKDPRIPDFISVVAANVTRDLRHAKIYVSVFGSDKEKKAAIKGLQSAAGYVRKELGKKVKLRYIPELHFELDDSIEHGVYMSKLINDTVESKD